MRARRDNARGDTAAAVARQQLCGQFIIAVVVRRTRARSVSMDREQPLSSLFACCCCRRSQQTFICVASDCDWPASRRFTFGRKRSEYATHARQLTSRDSCRSESCAKLVAVVALSRCCYFRSSSGATLMLRLPSSLGCSIVQRRNGASGALRARRSRSRCAIIMLPLTAATCFEPQLIIEISHSSSSSGSKLLLLPFARVRSAMDTCETCF